MKKLYVSAAALLMGLAVNAQTEFEREINIKEFDYQTPEMLSVTSPLKVTPIFIGGVDKVQTTATYGNAAGETVAKQWHDFIGVTPEKDANGIYTGMYWVSVNHEMIQNNDMIGDGGGMTVFKAQTESDGSVTVVNQTLADGRTGKYFNVDFVNTVGETGMNCGGIQAPNGRIWTAEEWFRSSNASLNDGTTPQRRLEDWTIETDIPGDFDGSVITKYQNFNWMVEIDPKEAVAVRKQYNWGRAGFEGGAISKDMKTVYLGIDATPAPFVKFVADVAGDFTTGKTYAYKEDAVGSKWIEIDNSKLAKMLAIGEEAIAVGATMYDRLEWVAIDTVTGMVYVSETGVDNLGGAWATANASGGTHASHHIARAAAQSADINSSDYKDYYGRVLRFNPATDEMSVLIEGGANDAMYDGKPSVGVSHYPAIHLSNPDGLTMMYQNNEKRYLVIQEDLNGRTMNRMPWGLENYICELFLLDLSIVNPTVEDLVRITATPSNAEVTGAQITPEGDVLLVNVQHPEANDMINNYPYTNSLTVAISGFEKLVSAAEKAKVLRNKDGFQVYPSVGSGEVFFNKITDVAVYNSNGVLVTTQYNTNKLNISNLTSGMYIVKNKEGEARSIVIQ